MGFYQPNRPESGQSPEPQNRLSFWEYYSLLAGGVSAFISYEAGLLLLEENLPAKIGLYAVGSAALYGIQRLIIRENLNSGFWITGWISYTGAETAIAGTRLFTENLDRFTENVIGAIAGGASGYLAWWLNRRIF